MSARALEYREILQDIVRFAWLLGDDERAEIAAMLSTAESNVLAAMAQNYPANVKNDVDNGFGAE